MDRAVLQQLLERPPTAHKYDFGHVLVVGGAPGMVGAPLLAARAALRVGAGLVTIASTADVIDKLEKRVEEVMTLRLSPGAQELPDFIKGRKVSVLVVGPGLKPELATAALKRLSTVKLPIIIDGGALAAVQQDPSLMIKGAVLTPHLGEFQRFFDDKLPAEPQLAEQAISFCRQNSVILVLKGHPTRIYGGDEAYENNSGGPELATAGTGDVLAGMIGGVIAQGVAPFAAAKASVYWHGLAGGLAAQAKTAPGVIASDVIESIPAALKLVAGRQL